MPALPEPDSAPSSTADKPTWRDWARQRRVRSDAALAGAEICAALRKWPVYESAAQVLLYLAFGDEPDLAPLFEDDRKTFYTTRTEEPPVLTMHRLEPDQLERHRFGFMQPAATSASVSADQIDLVLVPGLAFDLAGNRLGFGMGYYDRLLHAFPEKTPLVGVCPAALLVPRLPAEPHDVRMRYLATESGVLPVR
jgi:5-formyltetrahydrofolate cyclo-ligase